MNNLIKEIEKLIECSNENISILIKELNSDCDIYNFNSTEKLVSASIIKVPIMLAIFNEIKNGKTNLNDMILVTKNDILCDTEIFENGEKNYSINELINRMIIKSDNTATDVLLKHFGIENINHYIANVLKVKSTYLQKYMDVGVMNINNKMVYNGSSIYNSNNKK